MNTASHIFLCVGIVCLGCRSRDFNRSAVSDAANDPMRTPVPGSANGNHWINIDMARTDQFKTMYAALRRTEEGAIQVIPEPHPGLFELDGNRQGCDLCSLAYLDAGFDNGVIEVDIKGQRSPGQEEAQKGFVGVSFHLKMRSRNWETVYFRPHNAVPPGSPDNPKSIQYALWPSFHWYALRGGVLKVKNNEVVDETPPTVDISIGSKLYEGYAQGIEPGKWFTARIVVDGSKITTFVKTQNDNKFRQVQSVNNSPLIQQMNPPPLFGGGIGLVGEPGNEAFFKNFRFIHLHKNEIGTWLERN